MIYLLLRTYKSGGVRLMDTRTERAVLDRKAEKANRLEQDFNLPWTTSVIERVA